VGWLSVSGLQIARGSLWRFPLLVLVLVIEPEPEPGLVHAPEPGQTLSEALVLLAAAGVTVVSAEREPGRAVVEAVEHDVKLEYVGAVRRSSCIG
jgi:hypothetical protein